MHRSIAAVVFTIMALAASACGSDDSDGAAEPPQPTAESVPDDVVAPDDVVDPVAVDAWVGEVAQLLSDYYDAALGEQVDSPPESSVLDRWTTEAQRIADVAQAAIDGAPEPPGIADVDAAYATLLAAFERERDAAEAITAAIDESGPALEAEIEATPGATDTPLLEGTSLEPLTTELLRPTDGRIDDACFALTEELIDLSDVVLDCVGAGALVPDDIVTLEQTTTIETPGVTLEITADGEPSVRALTNGVQWQSGVDECVWVGRPAGVADPAGPAGFDPNEVGAMIDLPADLGPWIEAHPALRVVDQGLTEVADIEAVPYWDIAIPDENIFFVFVDSDPPDGCLVIGFDDRARLHLIPHENGPVLAITWLGGGPDPTEAGSRLDELEGLLDAITIIA